MTWSCNTPTLVDIQDSYLRLENRDTLSQRVTERPFATMNRMTPRGPPAKKGGSQSAKEKIPVIIGTLLKEAIAFQSLLGIQ